MRTTIPNAHLKDLLQDSDRCARMMVQHDGILMDYSRQLALPETMVRASFRPFQWMLLCNRITKYLFFLSFVLFCFYPFKLYTFVLGYAV